MKKLFLLSLFITSTIKSQVPGTQDMSFGNNGTTEFIINSDPFKGFHGGSMALLPNNDFLVGGVSNWGCSATSYYTGLIAKFNQNGILDTSYNQNGVLYNTGIVDAIKPSNDGNYFIIGQYYNLSKISASGSRINSWGTNGIVSMPSGYSIYDWVETNNNEVIITAIKRDYDAKYYSAMFKYNQNGTLVTSFGNNGRIDFTTSPNWFFTNVNVDTDGNLLFSGKKRTSPVYDDAQIVVFKTDINGIPITNFGTNGIFTVTDYNSYYNNKTFTFVTPDNGLIVSTGSPSGSLVVKVLPTAVLDTTFTNGYKFRPTVVNPINTFFIDNSIYVFGEWNGTSNFIVGKLNNNGNTDTNYGSNGQVTISRLPGLHNATRALQQENKIIIAETMDNFYCAQANWKLVMRRFDFKVPNTLSTYESEMTKGFNIYPNPTDDKIYLEGLDKDIELFSIDGNKMEAKIKNEQRKMIVDVSHLLKGIYIIKGKTIDGKIITKKFIKK